MPENEKILPPQTAYRKRLSDMLDLTYELEGLLHIGVTRSAVPPRLNQLIVDKLNAIVALADEPATPEELGVTVAGPEPEKESLTAPLAAAAPEEEPESAEEAEEDKADEPSATEDSAVDEKSDNRQVIKDEKIADETPADDEAYEAAHEEADEEDDDDDEADEDDDDAYEIPEETAETPRTPQRGRLFSINDRFLYSRELFGGNLKNFDAAIDEIITLDSYDEAEDYLATEWDVDPESPAGMKFLAVISKMF